MKIRMQRLRLFMGDTSIPVADRAHRFVRQAHWQALERLNRLLHFLALVRCLIQPEHQKKRQLIVRAPCAKGGAGFLRLLQTPLADEAADALGMVIVNELGLVCDPVAGLVEIPCIKRNAAGVILAYACADMALADIGLKIPADECITAMKEVGDRMSSDLKETAGGGLATTPTGRRLKEQVFGKE